MNTNATISARILAKMSEGLEVSDLDAVLGEGSFKRIAGELRAKAGK